MTPDESMIARMAIRHTMSVYNTSGDRGRIDELVAAFAPDGVIEVPQGRFEGRAAIHGFMSGVSGGQIGPDLRGSRHHVTTSRVEFENDGRAQAWSYFMVVREGAVCEHGVYVDRFEKVGADWLIAHRRVKIEWSGWPDLKPV